MTNTLNKKKCYTIHFTDYFKKNKGKDSKEIRW